MKELSIKNNVTMSSIEIVKIINDLREGGRAKIRHNDFLLKVEKVIGEPAKNFAGQYKAGNGQLQPCYNLPEREAHLMVMSESYKVQAAVYDKMVELKTAIAAPISELTTTMSDAMHAATIAATYLNLSETGKRSMLDSVNKAYGGILAIPPYSVDKGRSAEEACILKGFDKHATRTLRQLVMTRIHVLPFSTMSGNKSAAVKAVVTDMVKNGDLMVREENVYSVAM